jgi:hypothetical protein
MNYGWTPSSTNGFASYKKFPVKSTTVMVPFSTWNLRSQKDNRQHPYFANFPVDLTLQHPRANAWKVCRMEIGKVRHKTMMIQHETNLKISRFDNVSNRMHNVVRQLSVPLLLILWGDYIRRYICYQWKKIQSVSLDVKLCL